MPSDSFAQFSNSVDDPFSDSFQPIDPAALNFVRNSPGTADAAKPAALTEEQKKTAEIVKKYIQIGSVKRGSADVVNALAEEIDAQQITPPTDEDGKAAAAQSRLKRQIVIGQWDDIRKFLADLPDDVAPPVYSHLLTLLAKNKTAIVLPDEVLALADAAPVSLQESHLTSLAALLKRSTTLVEKPQVFFAKLSEGTDTLGGDDQPKRTLASQLLIKAGFLNEATEFLPPLEAAIEKSDLPSLDLHATHQLRIAQLKSDPKSYLSAWTLSHLILDADGVDEELRQATLSRVLGLLTNLPADVTKEWLSKTFSTNHRLTLEILSSVGKEVDAAFAAAQTTRRSKALLQLKLVVHHLLDEAGDDIAQWQQPVELLALGWVNEAQKSLGGIHRKMVKPNDKKISALPAQHVAECAPNAAWRKVIRPDVAHHIERLSGLLAARSGNKQRVLETIRVILPKDRDAAREMAELYVTQFRADSSTSHAHQELLSLRSFSRSSRSSAAIPLTRAKQKRSLASLTALLKEFANLGLDPLDDAIVVSAFARYHSQAEVYREEDIEQVFGAVDSLRTATAFTLATNMRPKLAQQWRRTDVQEQAGTRRTDKQMAAEIKRGYELAIKLMDAAVDRDKNEINARILGATLTFDMSEFLYGQKVDLETYAKCREQSFQKYHDAAKVYVAHVAKIPPNEFSIMPFQQWFQSALGASDLAYLTRQDKPDRDQVEKIADIFLELDKKVGDKHLQMFGEVITASIRQLPAQLKPHFLRQSLRILADHTSGQAIRDKLRYYDELLEEVQLHLALDGNSNVGHQKSFGAWVSIRSTIAVGRESGGFARLLGEYVSRSTGQRVDVKQLFEKDLNETLGERFEVELVHFLPKTIVPRAYGRTGWRETPLAYLLLSAKDPAVDRIPPVRLDLEFQDGSGAVLLPIESRPTLIDAKEKHPAARPVTEIKITQLLDDRELTKNIVRLEVAASAKGLVPELDQLLDISSSSVPGFEIAHVEDYGLDVSTIDTNADTFQPQSERRWRVELKPTSVGKALETFTFPIAQDQGTAMVYQRFADADIEEASASVVLDQPLLPTPYFWPGLIAIGSILLLGIIVLCFAGSRTATDNAAAKYQRPDNVTPFNVMVLLQRIYDDQELGLTDAERSQLSDTIDLVQHQYFSRQHDQELNTEQLVAFSDRWIPTGNGNHPAR